MSNQIQTRTIIINKATANNTFKIRFWDEFWFLKLVGLKLCYGSISDTDMEEIGSVYSSCLLREDINKVIISFNK